MRRKDNLPLCALLTLREVWSVEHRNVSFSIDILGVDTWRWTIRPRSPGDLTRVGQFRGTHEQAVANCRSQIDAILARDDAEHAQARETVTASRHPGES